MKIKYYIKKILYNIINSNEEKKASPLLNDKKYYRLHYINYHNIGTLYEMYNQQAVYEQIFKTFTLPEKMEKKEALKVLSYLTDCIEKKEGVEPFSLSLVKTLDSIIDLERFGFKRADFEPPEDMILDLFTINGRTWIFKRSKHYSKYFSWYTPKVKREEVIKIYQKYNMIFSDLIDIEEPVKKEPDVIIIKGMKTFEKESDTKKENVNTSNNPLKTIPESIMKLYAFIVNYNYIFFDTEEELVEYKKNIDNKSGVFVTIEYIEELAGRKDIFKITYEDGKVLYYTGIDLTGYAIYNEIKSIEEGRFVWEYEYGDLKEIYKSFRNRGIKFKNDIYEKEEELYHLLEERTKKLLKEKNKLQ